MLLDAVYILEQEYRIHAHGAIYTSHDSGLPILLPSPIQLFPCIVYTFKQEPINDGLLVQVQSVWADIAANLTPRSVSSFPQVN